MEKAREDAKAMARRFSQRVMTWAVDSPRDQAVRNIRFYRAVEAAALDALKPYEAETAADRAAFWERRLAVLTGATT